MEDSIANPRRAVERAKALVTDWHMEHVIGIYLNSRFVPTKIKLITVGTVDRAFLHPRETFRPALVNHAVNVILLHNHPSGQVGPSDADLSMAKRMRKAGRILGIPLIDCIIFTETGDHFSFKAHNLLEGGGDGV